MINNIRPRKLVPCFRSKKSNIEIKSIFLKVSSFGYHNAAIDH